MVSANYGGPASLDLVIDTGHKGEPGTTIYVSMGDPNTSQVVGMTSPRLHDVCINLRSNDGTGADPTYLHVFYYEIGDQGTRWYDKFGLIPTSFPSIIDAAYSNGTANESIIIKMTDPIYEVVSVMSSEQIALLKLQMIASGLGLLITMVSDKPSIKQMSVLDIEFDTTNKLVTVDIRIKAMEFSSGSWSNITGNRKTHVAISMV